MSGDYMMSRVNIIDLKDKRTYLELYEKKRKLVVVLKALKCKEAYDEILNLKETIIKESTNLEILEETKKTKKRKNKLMNVFNINFSKNKLVSVLDKVLKKNKLMKRFDFSLNNYNCSNIEEKEELLEDKLMRLKQEFFDNYSITFEGFADYVENNEEFFDKNRLLLIKSELNEILCQMNNIEKRNHDKEKLNKFNALLIKSNPSEKRNYYGNDKNIIKVKSA